MTYLQEQVRQAVKRQERIYGSLDGVMTPRKPLGRFRQVEQARLRPLPTTPYDLAICKQVQLHRDCYVVFKNVYYSAPFRLI